MKAIAVATLIVAGVFGWAAGGGFSHFKAAPAAVAGDSQTPHESGGTVILSAGWQGHYFTDGDVAGKSLNFIVDTGATTVALSPDQARWVGVDVDHRIYDRSMQTASGVTQAATVTLPQLRIGDIQLLNVPAVVVNSNSKVALLGQSFLSRIDKVSIESDRMTLTKL